MAKDTFSVDWKDYYSKLKPAIKEIEGELMNNPVALRYNRIEIYHMPQTDATLYFNASGTITIGHKEEKKLDETASELRRRSGLELKSVKSSEND